ncbi:MAG: ABC transporter ATP-binding protein [Alphaproteobacteria bacterium]|nr:ABC transporter ATP-binding protein [Alphaproteobacteria bacterium]
MSGVSLRGVVKRYGETTAVDAVDLDVAPGEFLAVLGPSGCGKTTLLRLVAGFESPDAGEITLGGRVVASPRGVVPPEERRAGVVFQSYALWPHMSVARNVGYALEIAGQTAAERERRVDAALSLVGLAGFGARAPNALSGGQRQRVALARCLAMSPDVLLLDEPLANLDAHLRAAMIEEFRAAHARTGLTTIYITHDQAEAMALATRVAVMFDGRIVQAATPADLYREPRDTRVGGFIGRGAIVPATILGPGRVEVLGRVVAARMPAGARPGPAQLCLRPEDLEPTATDADDAVRVRVHRCLYRGGGYELDVVPIAAVTPRLRLDSRTPVAEGGTLAVCILDGWALPD